MKANDFFPMCILLAALIPGPGRGPLAAPPPEAKSGRVVILASADMAKNHLTKGKDYEGKPGLIFFDGGRGDRPPAPLANPGDPAPASSDYSAFLDFLEETSDVEKIGLKEGDSISEAGQRLTQGKPDRSQVLIVAQPHRLEPRQVYEISKAVAAGMPTIFLVSNFSADLSPDAIQRKFPIHALRPDLDELLGSWGITLGKDLVVSRNCASAVVPQRIGNFTVQAPNFMPILLKAEGEAINRKHPLTSRIVGLVFPSTVGLTVDWEVTKKAGLRVTELANSGDQSYRVPVSISGPGPSVLGDKLLYQRTEYKGAFEDPRPLAVLLEGSFPSRSEIGSPPPGGSKN